MGIGQRVLHLRKNVLKLNQDEFSKRLNISRSLISNLEKGERNVTDRTVADICREFDVSEQWLRHGTGDMFEPESRDLDDLVAKYGRTLTQTQKAIIMALLKMNDAQRAAVESFIDELIDLRNKQ